MRRLLVLGTILLIGLCSGDAHASKTQEQYSRDVQKITKETLRSRLGHPDTVLLDVRVDDQWRVSEYKLPGAVHEDPEFVASWSKKYPKDKMLILY